jgi:uncharacterized protein with HEPN domain
MKGRLGDRIRLIHIQEAIYEIDSYLEEIEFFDFLNNSMLRFACIKQLEIIGEAAKKITAISPGKRLLACETF